MPDTKVDNEQSDPHETQSESGNSEPGKIRLWTIPAIVVLTIVWFLLIIPGKIAPLTLIHFASMQLAGVFGVVGLTIWWLLSRRVPWRTRILGYLSVLLITIACIFFGHPSSRLLMFIYGLPIGFSLLIGALFLLRHSEWKRRGRVAILVYSIFMVASLLVRLNDQDAAFGFTMAPRWHRSAEEKFIAEIQSRPEDASSIVAASLPTRITENDWAEFRGPKRNGSAENANFKTNWATNPPKEVWRKPIGPAWSSFCVVGDAFFTQEQRDHEEAVVAYSVADGSQLWVLSYPGRFEASMGGVGPRATPTYANGKLYVTGASGRIDCLDPASGASVWTFDAMEDRLNPIMAWGFAASPLVDGGQVFIANSDGEGRGVFALDAETGKRNWLSGKGSHTYSSCQLETIDGVRQVLLASNWGIQAFAPESGEVLWEHEWDIGTMARVTQPIVDGNAVFLTTGYGNGTRRIDVTKSDDDGWQVTEGWTTNQLKPYFNDAVLFEGCLYGFDGPIMVCLDAETGEKRWKGGRYGHGQVVLLPRMKAMLVVTEKGKRAGKKGRLILLEATSEKRVEIAEIPGVKGVTWNHPVVVGDKLFVRNAEEMVCFELAD